MHWTTTSRRWAKSGKPVWRLARACAAFLQCSLFFVAATAGVLHAQEVPRPQVPSSLYQALKWRNLGPYRGGRSVAVAGVPSEPNTFYFGGAGGGVFKSTNAGETWKNVTDGFLKTSSVGAIAVAPSDPNVIYIGMGEGTARANAVSEGDGVYKSTDAGRTWQHVGLASTRVISRILVDPRNPNVVYVAAQGDLYVPSQDRGVYRSNNGGKTWKQVLFVNSTAGPSDLAMDPTNPRILYAAFWDHRRLPWKMRSLGPGSGIFKSTDSGTTWRKIDHGLPALMGKIGIAVAANSSRLYAIIEAPDPKGGLYRSDNAGKTWTHVNHNTMLMSRPYYYMKVASDPRNPNVVWVLDMSLWKSTDGGYRFAPVKPAHTDTHDLWIDPGNPRRMILADDGGASVSVDGGKTWGSEDNQATGQFYRINTDDRFPYWIYSAQQDSTSVAIPSWSLNRGIAWNDWKRVGGCESADVAFNPHNPTLIYADCYLGQITELDMRTGSLHYVMPYPQLPVAFPLIDMKYRFTWNAPLLVSRFNSKVIYFAAQKLLRSEDGGRSWQPISPDLTRWNEAPQAQKEEPPNDGTGGDTYHTIFYVAQSPLSARIIWTGSDDGIIGLTRDGGKTWQRFSLPGIPNAQINAIDASPFDPAAAYVAATRFRYGDQRPYLFKTADFGRTWIPVSHGLPPDGWAHVVREDPVRRGLLYAGTETGVYVSFDDGEHWQSLQFNLPVTPVTDLKVHGSDLVISTSGRGIWVLDDVTPLRQIKAKLFTAAAFLYQPRPAIRTNLGTGRFETAISPRPWSPQGQNPPYGAILDFYIRKREPVSLEILDAACQVVRRFSTKAKNGSGIVPLHVKAGMNRVVWNLSLTVPQAPIPGLTVFRGMRGRLAVPGKYMLRLIASGKTISVPLTLAPDPRFHATPGQYAAQDRFLVSIERDLRGLYASVAQIGSVNRQIAQLLKRPRMDTAIVASGTSLEKKLTAVEDVLIQPKAIGIRVLVEHAELDSGFNFLHWVANDPDPEVTQEDRSFYGKISKELLVQQSRLKTLLGPDLDEFNRLVAGKKIAPIVVAR